MDCKGSMKIDLFAVTGGWNYLINNWEEGKINNGLKTIEKYKNDVVLVSIISFEKTCNLQIVKSELFKKRCFLCISRKYICFPSKIDGY